MVGWTENTEDEGAMSSLTAPTLTIKRQDGTYVELEWSKDVITIGRDTANDIVIGHPLASRRHARLERDEHGYHIRDLNSTNGTYLNGEPISGSRLLHHQDQIIISDTIITFHDADATIRMLSPKAPATEIEEELRVDNQTKSVFIRGQLLHPPLSVKEFQLLDLLYQRKGQVVSKEEIARHVWDYDIFDNNAIDVLVYRVRQRIEPRAHAPTYLLTLRGFGYKLVTRQRHDGMPSQ